MKNSFIILFVVFPFVLMSLLLFSNYRLNYSNSESIGIWEILPLTSIPKKGDHVIFCRPISVTSLHESCKPYLIKTIVGVPGDRVSMNTQGVHINQLLLNESRILNSRPSKYSLEKSFILSPNTFWVYGSNNPTRSYDSRYFGPIPLASIKAKAKLVYALPSLLE